MVVIHSTEMDGAERAAERLCDPGSGVSCHYLIDRRGAVLQLVDEERRAWHAGVAAWGTVSDVNSRSIGIELANRAPLPFPAAQMAALEALLADILDRRGVPPRRVIGHSDCAPGRKCDPGPRFDWARLARAGLAAATPQEGAGGEFTAAMRAAGYTASADPAILLRALRLRHRPWAEGPCNARDTGIAAGLAGQAD